jgi:hypothetical protein
MVQEATIKLLVGLRASKKPGACPITNLPAYLRQIARNIQIDHSRRSSPKRQMYNRLYYITTNSRFSEYVRRWPIQENWLAGLASWIGRDFQNTAEYIEYCKDDTAFCNYLFRAHKAASINDIKLPVVLYNYFKWIKTPLEEKRLVNHMIELTGYCNNECISLGDLAETSGKPEDEIVVYEQEPATGRLDWENIWRIICNLPPNTRTAYLLGLGHREMKILTGQVDPRERLAQTLAIDMNSLQALWFKLPMEDSEIADYLHTTIGNIQVMRHRAIRKIQTDGQNPPEM